MAANATLFIDANIYINLYGMVAGKKLLGSLEEQKTHILVTTQIVDEVYRNKLKVARAFFLAKFKNLDISEGSVPDHLFGIGDEKTTELRDSLKQAAKVKDELVNLTVKTFSEISRSEDEVSRRLMEIFDKALTPSPEELQRARDRKERGNPPGKPEDPLGDQISWEQLLTYCKGKHRIWLITADSDYHTTYEKTLLLNAKLYRELAAVCDEKPEVYCFSDLLNGIQHFGRNAGVKAENLPTVEEAKEIEQELNTLAPLAYNARMDAANMVAIRSHYANRGRVAYIANEPGFDPRLLEPGRAIYSAGPREQDVE